MLLLTAYGHVTNWELTCVFLPRHLHLSYNNGLSGPSVVNSLARTAKVTRTHPASYDDIDIVETGTEPYTLLSSLEISPHNNMSDPDTYDPDSYSDIRPGTHPELFDGPHNAPRSQQPASPQWWFWVIVAVMVAIILALGICVVCLWKRNKQHQRGRSGTEAGAELQPIPKVQFPFYFPPSAIPSGGMPCFPNRDTIGSAVENAVPFKELHPHLQERVNRDSQCENQFNPAFNAHRQQQLHDNDGAHTDVLLHTDASTMGPSTVTAPRTARNPRHLTPLLPEPLNMHQHQSERSAAPQNAAPHDAGLQVPATPLVQYPRAYMPPTHLPRPTDNSAAAESAFSAAQFPSAESEMTGYGETELTHDPWKAEAEKNKRVVEL
ncbi:uncharacterized protein K452DRAFT_305270 [Aplosporella prunicola CBS 121167]|uniref:Uncharacterized protein n=1 Tax=Aplosporella prunicola CBS 121167 TaxID=1176127 RepID=A0A6A6BQF6_9PEZI|nr:uncharacterized protein K452DRAFT_305270 [Aplosporella prunicola CBS 121167]KAF2146326.1 hypothetical protein K452DRAFT_305270 [Aplosporella prunicola CBS 121167]